MGQPTWLKTRSRKWEVTRGTETSKYLEEKKSIEIPQVVASERGLALKYAIGSNNEEEHVWKSMTEEGESPVHESLYLV
jgi:hypothetical protein